jgi:hypothetical protein
MKSMRSRNTLLALLACAVLIGCEPRQFILEPPDKTSLVHLESGLYVHRETELQVNAARFRTPPEGAASGAVPELATTRFFPLGAKSAYFKTSAERRGDRLVWKEVLNLGKYDFKGETSVGAHVRWEKDGSVTAYDVLEIFRFPPPDVSQINAWSPWVEASSRRGGLFGWHAEANKHAAEKPAVPAYPFQMRFRLVLSQRMYP